MSLVGFKAQNHRQQVGRRGPNPKVDDRQTAPETFDPLNERFLFTIRVAAECSRIAGAAESEDLAQSYGL